MWSSCNEVWDLENGQNINEKIVITPQKIPLCKPPNISPAFLGNIVWPSESPQKKHDKNFRRQKERLPHAITSKKWLSYWENIEDEKKKKKKISKRKRLPGRKRNKPQVKTELQKRIM